jgi:hypothetical protein
MGRETPTCEYGTGQIIPKGSHRSAGEKIQYKTKRKQEKKEKRMNA